MNILIVGSTGFIGRNLVNRLIADGHNLFVHCRDKHKGFEIFRNRVTMVNWDDLIHNPLNIKEETIECIINLAGEPIAAHKWNSKTKSKIISSRINTTHKIVDLIESKRINPRVLVNASAIGYYGPNDNDIITESSPAGKDFLANLCVKWEAEALKAEIYGVSVVIVRTGIVLGTEGALKRMIPPYNYYLGGSIGSGKQWMSWIHIDDLVEIYNYALSNLSLRLTTKDLQLIINATAPNAVTMDEFTKTIGNVLQKPSAFKVPAFILRLILGEMSNVILKGQRVYPEMLEKNGFTFKFSHLKEALTNIFNSN